LIVEKVVQEKIRDFNFYQADANFLRMKFGIANDK